MTDPDDELEQIRQRKREQLAQQTSGTPSPDEPVHVESADEFEELVSDGTVLVDFYADWCGPCKMLEPTVAAVAEKTDATVAKVDVDAHQGLAQQYGVRGVPTLYLFVDGEPAERMVGVQDESTLVNLVERA